VISSIGSVPERLPGITMNGEYYNFSDEDLPRYTGCENVYGVGNVVTGQGNIRVSLIHSQKVTTQLIETYLGVGNPNGSLSGMYKAAESQIAGQAQAIEEKIEKLPPLSENQVVAIERRIHALQERAGYTSDYPSWIAKVTPPDLE